MKYDAFISYRHSEVDMEIAKKVHAGLESFKVPVPVQKRAKKKRIRRVFRDQEELPIGSDLDETIATALYQSEFLIVICSPRTLESEWVMKEIDTFISMHGKSNIMAVLVEGEPWQSFPPQIMTDDYGRAIEPLAADVRGATKKERNEKLKSELLRLAAPILGCTYDDLKQRHRERKIRKTLGTVAAIAGAVAVAGSAFGVYSFTVANRMKRLAEEKSALAQEKEDLADELTSINYELSYSMEAQLANQSSYLAATSDMLYTQGNREDAVLVAAAALPDYEGEKPYIPEAEFALSKYLYAYSCGDSLGVDRSLTHDMPVISMVGNSDSRYMASVDSVGAIYIWETATGEKLLKLDASTDAHGTKVIPCDIAIDDENLYVVNKFGFTKYDFSGGVVYSVDAPDVITGAEFFIEDGLVFAKNEYEVFVFDTRRGVITAEVYSEGNLNLGTIMDYCAESGYFVITHYEFGLNYTGISIINCRHGYSEKYIELEGCEVYEVNVMEDGTVAALVAKNNDYGMGGAVKTDLLSIDCASGEVLWSDYEEYKIDYSRRFWIYLENRQYSDSYGEVIPETVVMLGSTISTYDSMTGELKAQWGMSSMISGIKIVDDYELGYVIQTNGNIDLVNFTNGAIYPNSVIATGKTIEDIWIKNGIYAIMETQNKDVTLMSYHKAPDLEAIDTDVRGTDGVLSTNEDYFVTYGMLSDMNYSFYSVDGEYYGSYDVSCGDYKKFSGFTSDNYFVMVQDIGCVCYWYNPIDDISYSCELFADYTSSYMMITDAYYTRNKQYALFRSGQYYSVVDLVNKTEIYAGYNGNAITGAAVSEDGSTVYLAFVDNAFCVIDCATDTSKEYDGLGLNTASMVNDNIVVSDDGKYVAVCCKDAVVRTLDTEAGIVTAELEIFSTQNCFMSFFTDMTMVLVHCNDEIINVIDAEDGNIFSQISMKVQNIRSMSVDWELNYYVIVSDDGVTLLNASDYKPVAFAPRGFGYITSTHTFLERYADTIYTTKYKNYEELIDEVGAQFPGAELTDEEMAKYNII